MSPSGAKDSVVFRTYLEILPQLRPDFRAVHTVVAPAVGVEGAVVVHDVDDGQAAAAPDLKVVGVVARSHFKGARAELAVHVAIGDDRDCPDSGASRL